MTLAQDKNNRTEGNVDNSVTFLPTNASHPSPRKRAVSIGLFWALSLGFVYITLFISTYGLLLFAAAVLLREFWLKKHQMTVLPRPFIAWVHRTKVYDVFVRRVRGKQNLRACRCFGGGFFSIAVLLLVINITSPVLDLEDMLVERGRYSHFVKLARKDPCGHILLTFLREDGTPVQFWSGYYEPPKGLLQSQGEVLTLWGDPNTYELFPECRKHPSLSQVQGTSYQRLYDKAHSAKFNRVLFILAIFFMVCSGLCLFWIAVDAMGKPDDTY